MSKTDVFLGSGWVGVAGLVIAAGASTFSLPEAFTIAGSLLFIGAGWVMLFTRKSDEYTQGLWTSGASLAFATLLILFLGLPFLEGAYDGLRGGERKQDIPTSTAIFSAILAFYVGMLWRRLRGGI